MKVTSLDSKESVSCPVLLMAFNRPSHTARVWESLRRAKPRKLWISQDGPRQDVTADREKCAKVREILEDVDWDCDVHRRYQERNGGCGQAVSSAIAWFLGEAQEGIILEDDTIPTPTFFRYCEELLEQYREKTSIASISGTNIFLEGFQNLLSRDVDGIPILNAIPSTYFCSWGWATWRDRWDGYSLIPDESTLAEYRQMIPRVAKTPWDAYILDRQLSAVHSGTLDTWDYQFEFHSWLNHRSHLLPSGNLVSNIGFDEEATHTTQNSTSSNAATTSFDRLAVQDSPEFGAELDQLIVLLRVRDTSFFQSILDEQKMLRSTCDERLELIERLDESIQNLKKSRKNRRNRSSERRSVEKRKSLHFLRKLFSRISIPRRQ